jgi:hypothetical protein
MRQADHRKNNNEQMKKTTVLIFLIGLHVISFAQQTKFINDPQKDLKQAKDYYQNEQFSLAYPILKDLQLRQRDAEKTTQALDSQQVTYYTRPGALRQDEEAAAGRANDVIDLEDNPGRAHRIRKRSNHITLIVDSKAEVAPEAAAEDTATAKKPTAKSGSPKKTATVKKAKASLRWDKRLTR